MSNSFESLNKGVPVEISRLPVDINTILELSSNREYAEKYFHILSSRIMDYLDKYVYHNSIRLLEVYTGLILNHNNETKSNELYLDEHSIFKGFLMYLNVEDELYDSVSNLVKNKELSNQVDLNTIIKDLILRKCDSLSMVSDDLVLKNKYPKLYEAYLGEKEAYNTFKDDIKRYKGNKRKIYDDYKKRGGTNSFEMLSDTLEMYSVRNFTKIYSNIIRDVVSKYNEIGTAISSYKTSILDDIKCDKDALEAFMAYLFMERITYSNDIEEKQKDLYYVTSYFKEHDNWKGKNKIIKHNNIEFDFDILRNAYINILVNNKELKTINIDRDEFENYTQEQVEEYMKLILDDAAANWIYFDETTEEERVETAIRNSTNNPSGGKKKKKTPEELRELYMRKKKFYENTNFFRVVEGQNAFEGYLAYIYPNGRVVMDRYFEKTKKGIEKIADEQAIYIMDIKEFYDITRNSKPDIIKEKLCTRKYHRGDWEGRVSSYIDQEGSNPYHEYNKLLKKKKIKDNIYTK